MLLDLVYYLLRYGKSSHSEQVLNILIEFRVVLGDDVLSRVFRLLDWNNAALATKLQDSTLQTTSPRLWALMTRAALSNGARSKRTIYRMRWRLSEMSKFGQDTSRPYGRCSENILQDGYTFSACFRRDIVRTGLLEPVRVTVRAKRVAVDSRVPYSPGRRRISVCLDIVEDGCVCEVWGNRDRSYPRGRRVWLKEHIPFYSFFHGASMTVMDGQDLLKWKQQHRHGCALMIVLRIFDEEEQDFSDIFRNSEKDCTFSGTDDMEGECCCYCEGCQEFRKIKYDKYESKWEYGIDMSNSTPFICEWNEDKQMMPEAMNINVTLGTAGKETDSLITDWGEGLAEMEDCFCCCST